MREQGRVLLQDFRAKRGFSSGVLLFFFFLKDNETYEVKMGEHLLNSDDFFINELAI